MKFKKAVAGLALTVGLFAVPQVLAETLTFTKAGSPEYSWAAEELQKQSNIDADSLNLSVALLDLNGDARNDIFAFAENSYFCGSAGCTPSVFLSNAEGWHEVPFGMNSMTNSSPGMWSVARGLTIEGHRVLVLEDDRGTFDYYWNQFEYVLAERND